MNWNRIAALTAALLVSACQSERIEPPVSDAPAQPVSARVVLQSHQCPEASRGIRFFATAVAWSQWQSRLNAFRPGGDSTANAENTVDFGAGRIVVIALGQKPTPGYAIRVDTGSNFAVLVGNELRISTESVVPDEGAFLAQMMTSPCVAIAVESTAFNSIVVTDEQGASIMEITIDGEIRANTGQA